MNFDKSQDTIKAYLAIKFIKRYLTIYENKDSDSISTWEDEDHEGFYTDLGYFYEGLDKFEAYLQEKISEEELVKLE